MNLSLKSIIVAAGIAVFSLTMIGCSGQVPGNSAYVPSGASAASLLPSMDIGADHAKKKKIEIDSSCSHRLHIVLAGLVDCKFSEKGYGGGTFDVANGAKGLILVSPSSGTKDTTFTIVGLVIGNGMVVWSDSNGRKYPVRVKVSL